MQMGASITYPHLQYEECAISENIPRNFRHAMSRHGSNGDLAPVELSSGATCIEGREYLKNPGRITARRYPDSSVAIYEQFHRNHAVTYRCEFHCHDFYMLLVQDIQPTNETDKSDPLHLHVQLVITIFR